MLPNDPIILYSYVNTQLRDKYKNFDALCEDEGVDRSEIEKKLNEVGFEYNPEINQFK